jgi:HK97 gp10 family phage protein
MASYGLIGSIGPSGKFLNFTLEADFRLLDTLEENVLRNVKEVVKKAGVDAVAGVLQNIHSKQLIKSGNLLGSVSTIPNTTDGLSVTIIVGAYYGIYLELGTSRMAARPFFGPAIDAIGPGFIAQVAAAIKRGAEGK